MEGIFLEKLRLKARVGVYPREKSALQTVEIDLQFGLPQPATRHDALDCTIDYAFVVERIRAELDSRHFNLLESLVEHLVALLFREFPMPWLKLRVAKIGVMKDVARVGVFVERTRIPPSHPSE